MPTLTVHLYKITNLSDDAHIDEADPYVKVCALMIPCLYFVFAY